MWKLAEDGNAFRTDGGAEVFIRQKFEVVFKRKHSDFGVFGNEITFDTFTSADDARRMIEDYVAERNKLEGTNG